MSRHILRGFAVCTLLLFGVAFTAMSAQGVKDSTSNRRPTAVDRAAIITLRKEQLKAHGEEITDTVSFRRTLVSCRGDKDCFLLDGKPRYFIGEPRLLKNGDIAVLTIFFGNDTRDDGGGTVMFRDQMLEIYRKTGKTWVKLPYAGPYVGH
jgi:hypothetical protein